MPPISECWTACDGGWTAGGERHALGQLGERALERLAVVGGDPAPGARRHDEGEARQHRVGGEDGQRGGEPGGDPARPLRLAAAASAAAARRCAATWSKVARKHSSFVLK